MLRDKLALWLGYRRYGRLQLEPPEKATRVVETRPEDGQGKTLFERPKHALYTEIIYHPTLRGRLLIALGGNVQVINVVWTWGESHAEVAADMQHFAINPPRVLTDWGQKR